MDTYVYIDSGKCIRCYQCIFLCSETYKLAGFLGHLTLGYKGAPTYEGDNPRCHCCGAVVDGERTNYACSKVCPTGAFEIERS